MNWVMLLGFSMNNLDLIGMYMWKLFVRIFWKFCFIILIDYFILKLMIIMWSMIIGVLCIIVLRLV